MEIQRSFQTFFHRNNTFNILNTVKRTRGIEEFFESSLHQKEDADTQKSPEEQNKQAKYRAGRAWKADYLRLKSNDDLHKLWFVLLKEKNMLLSERTRLGSGEAKATRIKAQLRKVKLSMKRIKVVMSERITEYRQFEALKAAKEFCSTNPSEPLPKNIVALLPKIEKTEDEKFKERISHYKTWWRNRYKRAILRRRMLDARKLGRLAHGTTLISDEAREAFVHQKLEKYINRKRAQNFEPAMRYNILTNSLTPKVEEITEEVTAEQEQKS